MSATTTDVLAGADLRRPGYRRETFLRFYDFHLRHGAHPGCVYYLMPYLRDRFGWDDEAALWFAFINGNTQHPVTSLLLHNQSPTPAGAEAMVRWFADHYGTLAFDTDRRHHKKAFPDAVASYVALLRGRPQAQFWAEAAGDGFRGVWAAATSIHSFGRLSAFSYAEYLRIMGVPFDCDTLFLHDLAGSKSHRNGLAIVAGLDHYDWHASNPSFAGHYPPGLIEYLEEVAADLLGDARRRAASSYAGDVSYFTLESALCTYKSWHRPNRRYPNVYNDMLHDRLKQSEARYPAADLSVFWEARLDRLPPYLRLEDMPGDPGVSPIKQNWYRTTGRTVVMGREDPALASEFDELVDACHWGTFR